MWRRLSLAALLLAAALPAQAQFATIAPTAPVLDNGDRIANTAWVNLFFNNLPLAQGKIYIGNASNIAIQVTPSGDCTIAVSGVVTCTQAAGNFNVLGNLTVGGISAFAGAATFNGGATVNGTMTVNGTFVDQNGNATINGNLTVNGSFNQRFPAKINGVTQPFFTTAVVPSQAGGVVWWSPFGGLQIVASPFPNKLLMSGFAGKSPVWTQTTWADNYPANSILYANQNNSVSATTSLPGAVQVGVASLNKGTNASSSTFWRGDGTWATGASGVVTVKKQTFCPSGCTTTIAGGASGTYTPSAGMLYATLECVGGGGGGGGVTGGATGFYEAAGGGSGGYSRALVAASDIGGSKTVFIGSGGTGVSGAAGNNGGASCVTATNCGSGQLVTGNGGNGGGTTTTGLIGTGGAGGSAGTGDIADPGNPGGNGFFNNTASNIQQTSGNGASSIWGGGALGVSASNTATAGTNALGHGAGGSAASASNSTNSAAGGTGSAGMCVATEYNSQ